MDVELNASMDCPVCGGETKKYGIVSGGEKHKRTYCTNCSWGMVKGV